jgi:hypothetical protein
MSLPLIPLTSTGPAPGRRAVLSRRIRLLGEVRHAQIPPS